MNSALIETRAHNQPIYNQHTQQAHPHHLDYTHTSTYTYTHLLNTFYIDLLSLDARDVLMNHPTNTHNWSGLGHAISPTECHTRSPTQFYCDGHPAMDLHVASPFQDADDEDAWLLSEEDMSMCAYGTADIVRRGMHHRMQIQQPLRYLQGGGGDDGLFGGQFGGHLRSQYQYRNPRRDSITCLPPSTPTPSLSDTDTDASTPSSDNHSQHSDTSRYEGMLGLLYLRHQHKYNLSALEGRIGEYYSTQEAVTSTHQPQPQSHIGDGVTFPQLVQYLLHNHSNSNSNDKGVTLCDAPCRRCIGINRRRLLAHIRQNLRYGGCARRVLEVVLRLFKCYLSPNANGVRDTHSNTRTHTNTNGNCFQLMAYRFYHPYKIAHMLTEDFRVSLDSVDGLEGFVYV